MILERQIRCEFQSTKVTLKVSLDCLPTFKTTFFASNYDIFSRSTFLDANGSRFILVLMIGSLKKISCKFLVKVILLPMSHGGGGLISVKKSHYVFGPECPSSNFDGLV